MNTLLKPQCHATNVTHGIKALSFKFKNASYYISPLLLYLFLFYSYNDFVIQIYIMEVMILNFNQFENQNFFNGNPSDTFKDLGKQVFNYFATPSFVTNIYETDELYYLEAELAGANKEDISIDFNNNVLTIQATRSAKYKSGKLILDERNFESLIRQFDFEAVDKQNITASFENGLLTITLPKIKPSNDTTSSTSIPIS